MIQVSALTSEERKAAFKEVNSKSDRAIAIALFSFFTFGLSLSFFYDTLFIALAVGGICLVAYFSIKILLPDKVLYQYVASAVLAVYSAQFIYQMHGLFEMHFFFFVSSALLITYRNWRLILPLFLITVIHHATFAWLQYSGNKEIYFTQLEYMDLQAFISHASLAAVIMGICAYWAFDLERTTLRDTAKSLLMAKQIANVKNSIEFAQHMSKGDLDIEFKMTDTNDELGQALISMRDDLKKSGQLEMEEKFISVGIAQISDVIRFNSHDFNKLSDEFIRNLVKYVGVNQAALFLKEDDNGETYLRLTACYAYERKKFLSLNVALGEGLVGQCFLAKEEIYITEVPENYIRITSGLGEATPRCILVVPVKTQDEIVGVVELASFRTFKEHEKHFVHKAAENIASAILSTKTTEHIKSLLEISQQREEEMRSQEEEMRQNLEELAATQEEMMRKSTEMENRIRAVEESGIASIEFNPEGTIVAANHSFLDLVGYTLQEILGNHHRIFVSSKMAASDEYHEFWKDLRNGISRGGEFPFVTRSGDVVYLKGNYSVLRDQHGEPVRILKLATDITAYKLKETDRKVESLLAV